MAKLIDEVANLKAQGHSVDEIAAQLNIPIFLARVLYSLV